MKRLSLLAFAVVLARLPVSAASGGSELPVRVPQLAAAPNVAADLNASWNGAAELNLSWDYNYRRPAEETTTVYLAQHARDLYVAWDVHQRTPLTVTQTTNGVGVDNDDNVSIVLYPQGTRGFTYVFRSNPLGARDQTSSENSNYTPQWESRGRRTAYGYVITMRIPLSVIRSGGSNAWHVQLVRKTVATNEDVVWTHNTAMQNDTDVNYTGIISGIELGRAALRTPPRMQLYGLGELASASAGGSTSRIGADLALPVTPTASFVATLHPDYSNVEIDQQSISPQEFPRTYKEVRPFFTQLYQQFNAHFACWHCPKTLYTPRIPVFSQGYALEGTQGPVTFGAFDAIGPGRIDNAQTATYQQTNRDDATLLGVQQVSVNSDEVHDVSDTVAAGYGFSHNHAGVFANFGTDRGTRVTDTSNGGYQEAGVYLSDQTTNVMVDYQRVGSQFQPMDGYVTHPGIAGLSVIASKTYNYSPKSELQQIAFSGNWDRYHDEAGQPNQSDQVLTASLHTRSQLGLSLNAGSSYLRTPSGEMLPFTQNGTTLSYRQNTATATNISYSHDAYYHGVLGSWFNSTGFRLARPLILTLEADTTHYVPHDAYGPGTSWNEIAANELLERASLDWQFSRAESLDFGVRRIAGIFAPTGFGYVPTAGTPAIDAMNLTAAFHFLALRNEFYVVYGNPNELSTEHALFLKWIRYVGAPKGT